MAPNRECEERGGKIHLVMSIWHWGAFGAVWTPVYQPIVERINLCGEETNLNCNVTKEKIRT
jgi:hypothetical protein